MHAMWGSVVGEGGMEWRRDACNVGECSRREGGMEWRRDACNVGECSRRGRDGVEEGCMQCGGVKEGCMQCGGV